MRGSGLTIMPKIVFVDATGAERAIDAKVGDTVMESARNNDVPAILGECGGCSSCGTCSVIVDSEWIERLGPASEIEAMILECSAAQGPQARLTCQIKVTDEIDGLRVTTPAKQN
jgi:2Fe-2S ferredoxin